MFREVIAICSAYDAAEFDGSYFEAIYSKLLKMDVISRPDQLYVNATCDLGVVHTNTGELLAFDIGWTAFDHNNFLIIGNIRKPDPDFAQNVAPNYVMITLPQPDLMLHLRIAIAQAVVAQAIMKLYAFRKM